VVRIQRKFLPFDLIRLLVTSLIIVKALDVSVIRAYGAEFEGLIAVLVGRLTKRPAIVSLHGEDDEVIRSRGFPWFVRAAAWIVITLVLSLASGVWCVSKGVADYARRRGARKGRIRVIYNKVVVDRMLNCSSMRRTAREELGYEDHDFVLIHVGRFSGDKRIHEMIEALLILKSRGATNVKLLLVGGPPRESSTGSLGGRRKSDYIRDFSTYHQITQMIEGGGLDDNVRITGFRPNDEVPFYLSAADAYLVAATLIGFGIALAEGAAAGLPIIGSKDVLVGDRGVLLNRRTGVAFEANNPSDLADKILQLRDDPGLRKRLGKAAQENVMRFTWRRIAEREAGFYDELISRNGRDE